jgi:ferritin-like metal-binding protein YciE
LALAGPTPGSGPVDVGEYQSLDQEVNQNNYDLPGGRTAETPKTVDSSLQEFFVNELKDLLWAEQKLVDTLPKMKEAAASLQLREAFDNHLIETEGHVQRLEQIFRVLGLEPDTTKCDAMDGIVDEGEEIISDTEDGTATRDVGLIFAGQKAEHYEIASYGGMVSLAKTLGYHQIADLLILTLNEEKAADDLLTKIAENNINYQASGEQKEKGFFS